MAFASRSKIGRVSLIGCQHILKGKTLIGVVLRLTCGVSFSTLVGWKGIAKFMVKDSSTNEILNCIKEIDRCRLQEFQQIAGDSLTDWLCKLGT